MTSEIFDKFTIELDDDYGSKHAYSIKVLNNNAKKVYNSKVFWELYRRKEDRDMRLESWKKSWQSRIDSMSERKSKRLNFVNPAKVGDILSASWGYDQTNIDYYQITKISGKAVYLREIGAHSSGEDGFMTAECTPKPGHFVGEEFRRLVRPGYSDAYSVSINEVAFASPWDGKPDRYSWYA